MKQYGMYPKTYNLLVEAVEAGVARAPRALDKAGLLTATVSDERTQGIIVDKVLEEICERFDIDPEGGE